jgi:tripartite-type tricarboxylate transporter receptor subunit TctC
VTSLRTSALAVAFVLSSSIAGAQPYPTKPVRLVVGWPPGGAADTAARPISIKLGEALGRSVVIDNRPGATGTIGAAVVAKAPPDGYTLLHGTSNELVMNPYEKMPYNSVEDFAPISMVIAFPSVMVVHPSVPVKTLPQFIQFLRARPGKINFATTGSGMSQVSAEMFKSLTKVDFAYIQYKGGGPAVLALVGGHVDASFSTLPSTVTFIKSGKLRALMVTDDKRSVAAPDIPSALEAGLKDFVLLTWNGLLAPPKTPAAILDRLHKEIVAVMQNEEMKERMLVSASEVRTTSREEFAAIIKNDLAKWTRFNPKSVGQ